MKFALPKISRIKRSKPAEILKTLQNMDPETATKYLDSMKNFAGNMRGVIDYCYEFCSTGFNSSRNDAIAALKLILDDLDYELKYGDRTRESKQYIIDSMIDVAKRIEKQENRRYFERLGWAAVFVGAVTSIAKLVFRFR